MFAPANMLTDGINAMIAAKAPVDTQKDAGTTALHFTARNSHSKAARLLSANCLTIQ